MDILKTDFLEAQKRLKNRELHPKNQDLLKKLVDCYNLADKQVLKFNKYYNRISHLFNDSYNLKLYDLKNYLYDNSEKMELSDHQASELFYKFCEYSYDCMLDDLAVDKNFFYKTVKFIGRSSSFYIFDIDKLHDFVDCDFNEIIIYRKITETISRLQYSDFYSLNDLWTIVDDILEKNDTFIYDDIDIERMILEYIDDLNYIIEFFSIESFKRFYDDEFSIYKYIRDFKRNQVDYFSDWYENNILEFND